MKYDVFISYSRKDYIDENDNIIKGNIVSKIKELLSENNISFWFDEEGIYSGDEFASVITKAIRDSQVFLFISSANSNASTWTSNEIATALMYNKPIIPFKTDDTPYNDSVMLRISSLDFIDYKNPDKAFVKLINSVKQKTNKHTSEGAHDNTQTGKLRINTFKLSIKSLSKNKGCILSVSFFSLFIIIGSTFFLFKPEYAMDSTPGDIDYIDIDSASVETDSVIQNDSIRTISINGIPIEMVLVEGGKFMMGDEYDKHEVELSSFYIARTEVTQELWNAVMFKSNNYYTGPKHPIDNVTFEKCQTFIHELNACTGQEFRLPTEAEWEYAARGGNKSKNFKFSGSDNVDEVAWYSVNSKTNKNNCFSCSTHEVATKKPNELGIYDMSGNVCEWCSDYIDWDLDYYKSLPKKNPQGPKTGIGHINRGGACNMIANCQKTNNRLHAVAQHGPQKPIGLRLVMPIK